MERVDWQKNPLIPAIAQDAATNEVLMLAYMDKEAYALTQESGYAHYYSRSRQKLWKKGESSGNFQRVKSLYLDCDNDTLLLKVEQQGGAACHTGRRSCFFNRVDKEEEKPEQLFAPQERYDILDLLYHTIQERKGADRRSSYTASLFHKGENSILKKVAEEASEFCFAIKDKNSGESVYEGADLLYHMLVALAYADIPPQRLLDELKRRQGVSGIEEKRSRRG